MEIFPAILLYSSMLLCFLTQQSSLKHSHNPFIMSPSFPLLFSFIWLTLSYLHLLKQAHTLLVHTKWSLPPFSICWAITCKIISQMKECWMLLPYCTRSSEWMQNCAEWKKHSFRCLRGAWGTDTELANLTWNDPHLCGLGKLILASNIHLGNWVEIIVL